MTKYLFSATDCEGQQTFITVENEPTVEAACVRAKALAAKDGWTNVRINAHSATTPELDQLYRRYQRYQNLAKHYQAVLGGLQSSDMTANPDAGTITFHTTAFQYLPKSIPRGKPMQWYLEKAQYYTAKASDASDVYWSLRDASTKRVWEALDHEGKLAELHEIGSQIVHIEQTIREYRAKISAWDRELAEHGPIRTVEDQVWASGHRLSNPHATVDVMTKALQKAHAERDWLLERL